MGQKQPELPSFAVLPGGWLAGARRTPSPNCNQRPLNISIDLIVIHNISLPPGVYGQGFVEAFFTNMLDRQAHPYFATICDLEVSAHLFIDRLGSVVQFVPFHQSAWHAGQSCFQGVDNCNDFSIGIELEGTDDEPYTEHQYRALAVISNKLMAHYPDITEERIVGHSDIAPARKTDPGPAFDWQNYRNLRHSLA